MKISSTEAQLSLEPPNIGPYSFIHFMELSAFVVSILHGRWSLLVRLNTKAFASHLLSFEQSHEALVNPPKIYDVALALTNVNVFE